MLKPTGPYTSRYIGLLVADFTATCLAGGVFMYPRPTASSQRKLRCLLYECNPIASIAEQAGVSPSSE